MKFIALKTDDGRITGNISFYCIALDVSRWGFYKYLKNRDNPWKYEALANEMREIQNEDPCNNTYGKVRMHEALLLKKEQEKVQKDLDFLSKKLSNQGFLAKAPEKLVEAEKAKLAKAQEKMDKIVQSMAALQ